MTTETSRRWKEVKSEKRKLITVATSPSPVAASRVTRTRAAGPVGTMSPKPRVVSAVAAK